MLSVIEGERKTNEIFTKKEISYKYFIKLQGLTCNFVLIKHKNSD